MTSGPVRLYYCDHYDFPLPEGHKFPLAKYRMVRERLGRDGRFELQEAPLATEQDLARVHTREYVESFVEGRLDAGTLRQIGFPWSLELVKRTLASTGGTLAATQEAVRTGQWCGSVAGGTHHAFRAAGAGFCVFNDLAVATEWARQCAGIERVAIIDLDVHQGDGTARIFEADESVFTVSLHGAHNFPLRKAHSRLDIAFADGAGAREYLPALEKALEAVWGFEPQLVLFQSGVDVLAGDRLGRLSLTLQDLAARDRLVLGGAYKRKIPVVITMGGGYSDPIELTVAAHAQTYIIAAGIFRR